MNRQSLIISIARYLEPWRMVQNSSDSRSEEHYCRVVYDPMKRWFIVRHNSNLCIDTCM